MFCLPLIAGYGLIYEMAIALEDRAGVIAFDFIDETDRLDQYRAMINSMQSEVSFSG
ncbi:hypothetical protein PghCCS26_46080 [Paenibacillus glycanilyticus]|uniref:Uncharacterized protein n=1 Tax=Paenibacillus glycanilyticus TaxID=126569 RepID=A0ABQ6NRN7_9BACL|nr:hypothetical protein PghCCS26_46080 [Paenibacillus glycanilyticus]